MYVSVREGVGEMMKKEDEHMIKQEEGRITEMWKIKRKA